jgi:hypothetical protein
MNGYNQSFQGKNTRDKPISPYIMD